MTNVTATIVLTPRNASNARTRGANDHSGRKFRFCRKAGNKWEHFTLNAQPRSLYVMTGASRHVWEHSIPPVETPRYSITFRTMAQA